MGLDNGVPHFEQEGRINPVTPVDQMSEQMYAIALDHLVFACVDLALTHQGQVLLARRNRYPRKSWWLLGGRMVAGENPLATAARKLAEEAGLVGVGGDRFLYVGVYSTSFAQRQQAPADHGSHTVNLTFQLELTAAEKGQLWLNDEYNPDWRWVCLDQVSSLLSGNILDQALLQTIADLKINTTHQN